MFYVKLHPVHTEQWSISYYNRSHTL